MCYFGPDITHQQSEINECATVPDADFTDEDTIWTLAGSVSITNSIATLPPGSAVSQNLSLSANKTYNAVIEATVTNPVDLVAGLGFGENSDNETLTIASSGWYTATLSTPPNLSGAIAYTLFNNDATDSIDIGFTCLYLSSTEIACLAPTNGTFENDSGWIWYRDAVWRQPARLAYLPYASKGLVSSSSSYEFPELDEGQYLLMGFDALGEGNDSGVISGRARSGFNDIVYNYQAFPTFYRYEMDLTSMAGMTTTLAFANPGADGIEGIVSSANVELDNICVFVSDRPLQLPHPVDPDGITPVELGFNYTSCDDIDGILAGWGVNIQQYRAEYLAGASLWDPIGWVPWLIAAMWNILATYLCIFMAAFVTLVDILEYIINNFLNIGNWLVRSIQTLPAFLANVLSWLTNTASNIGGWWGTTLIALVIWWVASGGNIFAFFGLVFNALWLALKNWAGWFPSYEPVARQISLNGFRGIANVLMAGRNALISGLGPAMSNPINAAFLAWNALSPFFTSISGFLAMPGLLFGLGLLFFSSVFDLVLMFAAWVWENVFMVASLPFQFYYAFDNGLNSTAYNALVNCAGTNFWCTFLSGVQLINQLVSHTVLYPIVITGIIIGTFVVFGRHLWALFTIEVK